MASNSAAWVFGGVRLISSARITLLNSGPSRKRKSRAPVLRFSSITSVPVMSAGMRSGVNWMRLKREVQRPAQRADHQRLGQPRHAFQQAMAPAEQRNQQFLDHLGLADDHLAQLVHDFLPARQPFDGGAVDGCVLVAHGFSCGCNLV